MKKIIVILILLISLSSINSQENDFFLKLTNKELATFNDAISLMRLLYDEEDYDANFLNNILWAAEKKLFQVKIPIAPDKINPIITRRELAFWISKVFNIEGGIINTEYLTRYKSYRACVNKGIIEKGRGSFDSFTGTELLDSFAYLDYFVRHNEIKPKSGELEVYDDTYEDVPLWRQRIYKELEEQRAKEKAERLLRREKWKEKFQKKQTIKKEKQSEKFIDKDKAKK